MKALYVQMMDLYLIFRIFQGTLPWQPNNVAKMLSCYRRLIPLAFVALVLENELQYYGLAMRVDDYKNHKR